MFVPSDAFLGFSVRVLFDRVDTLELVVLQPTSVTRNTVRRAEVFGDRVYRDRPGVGLFPEQLFCFSNPDAVAYAQALLLLCVQVVGLHPAHAADALAGRFVRVRLVR